MSADVDHPQRVGEAPPCAIVKHIPNGKWRVVWTFFNAIFKV